MKRYKRIAMLLLCMLAAAMPLLSCVPITAFAQAVPEEGRLGSITVTMRYGDKKVSGGTLTLYRVGEVHEDDGNYSFKPTGDFTGWGDDFGDIHSPELAERLAEYASKLPNQPDPSPIGADGKVCFDKLEQGLYLLVQKEAATGYSKIKPFLVSVPYLEDGEYVYDVKPCTKAELIQNPKPTGSSGSSGSSTPSKPGTKLPQTGQLNWPVPVLAILGMTLFAVGWMLRFRKRDDNAQ